MYLGLGFRQWGGLEASIMARQLANRMETEIEVVGLMMPGLIKGRRAKRDQLVTGKDEWRQERRVLRW